MTYRNIADCIATARENGDIERVRADEAEKIARELQARYETIMPPEAAAVRVSAEIKQLTRENRQALVHMRANQLRVMAKIENDILSSDRPDQVLTSLIEHSDNRTYRGEAVRSVRESLERMINAHIQEFLRNAGANIVGMSRNKALMLEVVRELFGEATGNANAKRMADAIRSAQEMMRQQFNAHGGNIGKLENRGVAQSHDAHKLIRAGKREWAEKIRQGLDWHRIINNRTGQPFAEADGGIPPMWQVERFLDEVYENIVSGGWVKKDATLQAGGKALYNQRADHRVLHFKSADDWLTYNAEFGGRDPFTAVMQDAYGLARDVALMRVLGPNPHAGMEYATQVATKLAKTRQAAAETDAEKAAAAKLVNDVRFKAVLAKDMLDYETGVANVPVGKYWANLGGSLRNTVTSAYLGSALLSSLSDVWTYSRAAKVMGMKPNNIVARHVELLASPGMREVAAQAGFVAESLANSGGAMARWTDGAYGLEVTRKMADFTLRATGLSGWTDMARNAFRMETAAYMANQADRAFADLDEPLRRMLETRNISARDWDLIRQPDTLFTAPNGAKFLSLTHWRNVTDVPADQAFDLAIRVMSAVEEQLEFAVPTQRIEMRARVMGAPQPGTLAGEVARFGMQFKGYGLSFFFGQYRRVLALPTTADKLTYMAMMGAGLMLTAAIALQAKSIVQGKDPRPMDDPKFWLATAAQSGGFGIFGDFLFSETSRAGGGMAGAAMGPVVGMMSEAAQIPMGALNRVAEGGDARIGAGIAEFVEGNTPFASSAWHSRLFFDRLVADNIQQFLDPEADAALRREIRRQERDFEAPFWWEPGTRAPQRGPDMTNVVR